MCRAPKACSCPRAAYAHDMHLWTSCRNLHPKTLAEGAEVQVGFAGEFGAARVSPRELLSSYVGHLVCIEGIVTKASTVRPKWVRSVHYCPANGKTTTREYRCGQRSHCDLLTANHRPAEVLAQPSTCHSMTSVVAAPRIYAALAVRRQEFAF